MDQLKSLRQAVLRFQKPTLAKSVWQLANTLVPYFAFWALAYALLDVSYLAALVSCFCATCFLARLFSIHHDLSHGALFKSSVANQVVGCALSLITWVPYHRWAADHVRHHANLGHLGRRGSGDVWTMTVSEYAAATRFERFQYRLYRNSIFLFGFGPTALFVVWMRFTGRGRTRKDFLSVHLTNAGLLALVLGGVYFIGWKRYLLVQGPILVMGSTIATWLFYMQHQFENMYWEYPPEWDFTKSALHGASYYKLPKLLQWFTGNIGIHHVHHYSAKIPNYELQRCMDEIPAFQNPTGIVTLRESIRCARLKLWDENKKRLVSWREAGF